MSLDLLCIIGETVGSSAERRLQFCKRKQEQLCQRGPQKKLKLSDTKPDGVWVCVVL